MADVREADSLLAWAQALLEEYAVGRGGVSSWLLAYGDWQQRDDARREVDS